MNSLFGSNPFGARLLAATGLIAFAFTTNVAHAQSALPEGITDEVVNVLIESRTQQPASQASAEDRAVAVQELANIYAVSDLPKALELAENPSVKAQLDLQRRVLIFNAFATDFLENNQPTEQEIFNTYQEQVGLSPPEEFKARHILVDAQGAAMSLIAELDEGADFAKLAEEHSTGPSSTSGGDLGWFPVNAMVKQFSDALVLLEDGAYTKAPVQTQFGWHVILREDSRVSTPPPMESVRDVIAQRISQDKLMEFVTNLTSKTAD
jgi:peptidyl-prolyl cis-trans isomerase C